jgi:SMI1-KNR4 cell-wall
MWRERIQALTQKAEFAKPASVASIGDAEEKLGVQLPAELTEILRESDGIMGEYGLGLLWPIDRILTDNVNFRDSADFGSLYMPFDCLLFFSDAGNGDQFAYSILQTEVTRNDIFVWDHENDSRTWVAPSLGVFYNWWLTGKLKI